MSDKVLRKIVEVEWVDASTVHHWHKEDEPHRLSLVRSVGYVVQDDEEKLSLCESLNETPAGENVESFGYGCVVTIPQRSIKKVTVLKFENAS